MRLEALELGITVDDEEELSQSSIMTEKLPDPLPITHYPLLRLTILWSADHLDENNWISSHEKAIVIQNVMDSALATRFLAYYERPEIINQKHDYKTVIHDGAITRIQLRLRSGAFSTLVKQEDIETFPVNSDGTALELVEIARMSFLVLQCLVTYRCIWTKYIILTDVFDTSYWCLQYLKHFHGIKFSSSGRFNTP